MQLCTDAAYVKEKECINWCVSMESAQRRKSYTSRFCRCALWVRTLFSNTTVTRTTKNKTLKLQIKQKHWLSWKGSYESSAWFWMYAKILDRECKTDKNTVCTHKKYKRVTFIAEWIKFITYKKKQQHENSMLEYRHLPLCPTELILRVNDLFFKTI